WQPGKYDRAERIRCHCGCHTRARAVGAPGRWTPVASDEDPERMRDQRRTACSSSLPVVLGALLALSLLLAPLAAATPPRKNGRIAFMVKDAAGHWQTWVGGPHLSDAKELTTGRADSADAVWSPDGKKLAFDSSRTDPNPKDSKAINDVFTMNPN